MGKNKKYNKSELDNRIHYGSNSNTSGKSMNKKTNLICSNPKCNYSSRVWIWKFNPNKISVSSITCPIHGNTMINVGNGSNLPKAGTKKRKQLIEKYTHSYKF
jgi:hypothetical protein